jgi:hypothetical protein
LIATQRRHHRLMLLKLFFAADWISGKYMIAKIRAVGWCEGFHVVFSLVLTRKASHCAAFTNVWRGIPGCEQTSNMCKQRFYVQSNAVHSLSIATILRHMNGQTTDQGPIPCDIRAIERTQQPLMQPYYP